jgi:hypothetical protein
MSWAERLKAGPSAQKDVSTAAPSSTPSVVSSSLPTSELASTHMVSTRSSSSESSMGQNTTESVTTDQTRPGTESEATSTATTSSIPSIADSETVDPKQDDTTVATPAPVAPPVNVWALRKEKMAQAQAAPQPVPLPESRPPADTKPSNGVSSSTAQKSERSRAPSKNESTKPPGTSHQRDMSKPGGAIAVGVSATSVPANTFPATKATSVAADASSWPTPVEESNVTPTALPRKTRTPSDDNESKLGDFTKGEKKKSALLFLFCSSQLRQGPCAQPNGFPFKPISRSSLRPLLPQDATKPLLPTANESRALTAAPATEHGKLPPILPSMASTRNATATAISRLALPRSLPWKTDLERMAWWRMTCTRLLVYRPNSTTLHPNRSRPTHRHFNPRRHTMHRIKQGQEVRK